MRQQSTTSYMTTATELIQLADMSTADALLDKSVLVPETCLMVAIKPPLTKHVHTFKIDTAEL